MSRADSDNPPAGAALSVDVRVARGAFVLEAEVSVEPGEVLGVIGANGSGKSTLLGAIAGTIGVAGGNVALGGRDLSRTEPNSPVISLPRSERRVGLLDQRARLFPHLSARANVAFGPRSQGVPRRTADLLAEEWLERVGLSGRGSAREEELSGGQQQRVAIARTLAAGPELLLLDEPFAALDVAGSAALRHLLTSEIGRLGVAAIIVTHDPVDLIALADRVVVLEQGRIGQCGTVTGVLGVPSTPFAAEFAGRALISGVASPHGTLLVDGTPVPELHGRGALPEPGVIGVVSFDPTEVRLEPLPTDGAPLSSRPAAVPTERGSDEPSQSAPDPAGADELRWVGTVSAVSASRTGVRVACAEWPEFYAEIPVARALDLQLSEGDPVELRLPSGALRFAVPNIESDGTMRSRRGASRTTAV